MTPILTRLFVLTALLAPNAGRPEAGMGIIERAPDPNRGMYRELTPEERRLRRTCFLVLPPDVKAQHRACLRIPDEEDCKRQSTCQWRHAGAQCWGKKQTACLQPVQSLCEIELVETYPAGADPMKRLVCRPDGSGRIIEVAR